MIKALALALIALLGMAAVARADIVHISCYVNKDDCADKDQVFKLCSSKLTAKSFGATWGCPCSVVYTTKTQADMDAAQLCEKKGAGAPIYSNKMKSQKLPSIVPKEYATPAAGGAAIREAYTRFAVAGK